MSAEREFTAIEEMAADWMIERDRGLSPTRERELTQWLQADPRHVTAFNALAETWALLGGVSSAAPVLNGPGRDRRIFRRWLPAALAAAAVVTVAFFGIGRKAYPEARDPSAPFAMTATTEVGVLRNVELPDGSVIQLNTDSAIDVRFGPDERRVTLSRGEVHFTVARNAARPFIVSVAGVDVRVIGTVFNVRLRAERVDVLVTEGKVRVDAATPVAAPVAGPNARVHSELTAGQKLSIELSNAVPASPARAELSQSEIKQVLAWQARRLEFDATPLTDIVAEINRYNRHKLVIAEPRLESQRFGGSFPAGDHETFVRMLETSFGVIAERTADETRLRLKSAPR